MIGGVTCITSLRILLRGRRCSGERLDHPVGWGEVFGGEVKGALRLLFEHPGGRVFGREVRGALSVSSVRPGGEEGCSEERFVVL